MRPEAVGEAWDWLTRAEHDLETVARVLQTPHALPDIGVYHAQQAAEKAFKAFLTAHDQPFPRTHDLERLALLCQAIDPRFGRYAPAARTLTPYAVEFRYPGGPLEPQQSEAEEAQRMATDIVAFVRERLTASGVP